MSLLCLWSLDNKSWQENIISNMSIKNRNITNYAQLLLCSEGLQDQQVMLYKLRYSPTVVLLVGS